MGFAIEMRGIRKTFPGIVANDGITLEVEEGEIHAILGENGAGKSTLMNILFGLCAPDSGTIKVKGKEVRIKSPNDAYELGIGMVHQHFQLVQNFTVAENIILGKEGGFLYDLKAARKRIMELSKEYGLSIDPDMTISKISVGMQQRVEILKMLYRDADILIFDEPTAVLTPREIEELLQIMKTLAESGKTIILITHKIGEIKQVASRCTVIRRGRLVKVVDVESTSAADMAEMMVGHPVDFKVEKAPAKIGDVILDISNLDVMGSDNVLAVKNFSLKVHGGEIVGIAGVDGNGQSELVEAITGIRPAKSGRVTFKGKEITHSSIEERNEMGIGHIPEDRQKRALILSSPLTVNMVIKRFKKEPFSHNGILDYPAMKSCTEKIIEEFDVRSSEGPDSLAFSLSGGNQQKAVIGREITSDPDLLILVQPTRGLDAGAIEFIHKAIVKERDKGKAVLLVSFELDEIFNLSDRIAVINAGTLVDILPSDKCDSRTVGLMMAGLRKEGA